MRFIRFLRWVFAQRRLSNLRATPLYEEFSTPLPRSHTGQCKLFARLTFVGSLCVTADYTKVTVICVNSSVKFSDNRDGGLIVRRKNYSVGRRRGPDHPGGRVGACRLGQTQAQAAPRSFDLLALCS